RFCGAGPKLRSKEKAAHIAVSRLNLGGASLIRTGDLRIMIQFDGNALMELCLFNQTVRSSVNRYACAMFCYAVDAWLTR
ncbi:hypothetical protein, partial [Alcaligenes faecalis]